MSKTKWAGQDEFLAVLGKLPQGEVRPISPSKLKSVADAAVKFQPEYKMVVYEIEKYIKKSHVADKLGGVLVIDNICVVKGNSVFPARFGLRLKETFATLSSIGAEDQGILRTVLENWIKLELFPKTQLEEIISDTCSRATFTLDSQPALVASTPAIARPSDPRLKRSAPVTSVDSSASVVEYSKVVTVASSSSATSKASTTEPSKLKGPVVFAKLCPFRLNDATSCPFGSHCRYSHQDWNARQSIFATPNASFSSQHNTGVDRKPKYFVKCAWMKTASAVGMSNKDDMTTKRSDSVAPYIVCLRSEFVGKAKNEPSSDGSVNVVVGQSFCKTKRISKEIFASVLKRQKINEL